MIRLRYVLVAGIVLALVPWVTDGLPSLACAIPTVECLDESPAVVSDEKASASSLDAPAPDAYTHRLRALAQSDQSDSGKTLGTVDVALDHVVGLAVDTFTVGAASGLVSVNWTAEEEGDVVNYVIDRKPEGAASYDLNVEVGYPHGDGTQYSLYDDPHGTGTFIYRLRATLTNGTDRILAEGGVTL